MESYFNVEGYSNFLILQRKDTSRESPKEKKRKGKETNGIFK